MIAYLKGSIEELTPTIMYIECCGVGYQVNISLNTYTAFSEKKDVKVLITPIYREDAHLLYGFATKEEQDLFSLLITVSGVGPNTARVILSGYSVAELSQIIYNGQIDKLKAVKGIGLKTAQRILVDLKDKITVSQGDIQSAEIKKNDIQLDSESSKEAISALKILGYNDVAIKKVVKQILSKQPNSNVEYIIKQALLML